MLGLVGYIYLKVKLALKFSVENLFGASIVEIQSN